MSRLHFFNPGYEAAIASGKTEYTPPANVRKMRKELALLPIWYADEGDFILLEKESSPALAEIIKTDHFPAVIFSYHDKKLLRLITAFPWGVSPDTIRILDRLKATQIPTLKVPVWKKEYVELSGRQTAAQSLESIRKYPPDDPFPSSPMFCHNETEIEAFISQHQPPFILKTPYSSSGRGLRWIDEKELTISDRAWINGALKRQRSVSIENALDKIQDFALEFCLNEQGKANYEGISLFNTVEKGAYTGNQLKDQESLHDTIFQLTGETYFHRILGSVRSIIEKTFGKIYSGYIGVDMLVYKSDKGNLIHPFIEINMRYTMGMVAIQLFRRYIHPTASGYFSVNYSAHACEEDIRMKKEHPLIIEDNLIKQGYLSLCPVEKGTHYRAFMVIG